MVVLVIPEVTWVAIKSEPTQNQTAENQTRPQERQISNSSEEAEAQPPWTTGFYGLNECEE